MGILDRYKKKGGFLQLLTLIETSSKQKQDNFLSLIMQEDPFWERVLRLKILSIERVLSWPESTLVEIFTRVQPLTVAVAFHGLTNDEFERRFSFLGSADRRKLFNLSTEVNPTASEKLSCVMKLITEVRLLSNQGIVKFEKIDPDLVIDENIEEKIQNNPSLFFSSGSEYSGQEASAKISADGLNFSAAEGKFKNNENSTDLKFEIKNSSISENHSESISNDKMNKTNVANKLGLTSQAFENEHLEELEALKKRIKSLQSENLELKNENSILKSKLAQIKKIA